MKKEHVSQWHVPSQTVFDRSFGFGVHRHIRCRIVFFSGGLLFETIPIVSVIIHPLSDTWLQSVIHGFHRPSLDALRKDEGSGSDGSSHAGAPQWGVCVNTSGTSC